MTGTVQRCAAQVRGWLRNVGRMVPQYATSARYRPPPALYARLQWIGLGLTRLGLTPRGVVTLEVPGRRSGALRRTNVLTIEHDGRRHLVSLAGESQWARNVRAAQGRVVLQRGRRRRAVTLVEVPVDERPAALRSYVLRWGRRPGQRAVTREAAGYFGVGPELAVEEFTQVAGRYPVFRVEEIRARE